MAIYTAPRRLWPAMFLTSLIAIVPLGAQSGSVQLPTGPLKFGEFAASFHADGSFHLEGWGWPTMNGTWKLQGDEITLVIRGQTTQEYATARAGIACRCRISILSSMSSRMIVYRGA